MMRSSKDGWPALRGRRRSGRDVDASRIGELVLSASAGDAVVLPPELAEGPGKQFACLCMDVTTKELKTAVTEGFDSLELLKRYTTVTMGPCQGKACMLSSQRLCARATGSSFEETGPRRPRALHGPLSSSGRSPAPDERRGRRRRSISSTATPGRRSCGRETGDGRTTTRRPRTRSTRCAIG